MPIQNTPRPLPCPFCGSTDVSLRNSTLHQIECAQCGAEGPTTSHPGPELATARWNDRRVVSDGYHTFDELYWHRNALFLVLMKANPKHSWFSRSHSDDTFIAGWFIAGMVLPSRTTVGGKATVTYHMPLALWALARETGAKMIDRAPAWDGHTPSDVLERLLDVVTKVGPEPISIGEHKSRLTVELELSNTRAALLAILDAVDYTAHACRLTDFVGSVLDVKLIKNARKVLSGGAS